jgi:hypothetical protein
MNSYEQHDEHCVVASICMVLDLNYNYYARRFPAVTVWNHHNKLWRSKAAKALAARVARALEEPVRALRLTDKKFYECIAEGRGLVIIDRRGSKAAHCVAYENGIIYDPASHYLPGVKTPADLWRQECKDRFWYLVAILPV